MAEGKIKMRRRMTLVLILTFVGLFLVTLKLGAVQLVHGSELKQEAEEVRTRDIGVAAARGTIYDRNGNKLAVSITADSIAALPQVVRSYDQAEETAGSAALTAAFLAEQLDLDYQTVYENITSNASYVWVKRKIDFDVAQTIKEAALDAEDEGSPLLAGIEIEEETQRYYPKGTLAAHVLGYAGIDNQGLDGVEVALDSLLRGTDGRVVGQYDSAGNPILQAEYEYIPPEDGFDIYLTIDENIQYFCERELAALQSSDYPAKQAGIIIMDPETCSILAMACTDPYDPNKYADYPESSRRNFLVSDSYEPGSTFKIITAATALEEGTVNQNTSSFYDPGFVSVAGAQIHCWASVPHGTQTLAEAIKNSCNPAFVAIGQSIEAKEEGLFYKYIQAFGFGSVTGVDLPGEASGILQDESNVNAVEVATISIGQGIAVTPLQLITAVCAVANDGVLLRPQIVSKVMDGDTLVYETEPEPVRQVISASTASDLRELLVGVVTEGSGGNAAISGYTIAGKTGTAQKASGGSYADHKYVASFIGMVPADDPELVCLVVVDEPSGVFYGSQVAAPIFKAVMSDVLRYMGIAPSEIANSESENEEQILVQVPNLVNLDTASAVEKLRALGLTAEVVGDGQLVTEQTPSASSKLYSGSTVALHTGGVDTRDGATQVTVPSLHGKRLAEVAELLSSLGLTMSAEGSGVAYGQSPSAGSVVESGATIQVCFSEEENTILPIDP